MNITINPFQQLYFSDDAQSETNFVELFSREVLQTAIHPIFQEGNVVLSGAQGCGKTMILNLLRPEIRLAYSKSGKLDDFPVNKQLRKFISAGINLTQSRITDLVQISLNKGADVDAKELPYYFADFFNYLVVEDLISSVEMAGKHAAVFDELVKLKRIDTFARNLAKDDCWFGFLVGVDSFASLKVRIANRINFYRRWVNGNLAEAEPETSIRQSKTNIGEPISRTAEYLRKYDIINKQAPVLIRVDQIEEMHRAFNDRQRILLLSFRKMLNRAFATRDARVHYRAGTRKYGWNNPDFLGIWGSDARLENRRDYNLIQMEKELFEVGETRNSVFERFAIDAFQKRVAFFFRHEVDSVDLRNALAKSVFGKHPAAYERLQQLSSHATDIQIDKALALDSPGEEGKWTNEWRDFLRAEYKKGHEGMLNAVLAAAWGRQTGGRKGAPEHRKLPPPVRLAPWRTRKWWRKERLDQAVLQLTTRCQQRFMWWGFDDIRSLSGGNITVFLHICHRIWDGFLKNESSLSLDRRTDLLDGGTIDKHIQAAGILFASNEWFQKLPEEPEGNARQRFVEQLGIRLNHDMIHDLAMTYPGGNGISIQSTKFDSLDDETLTSLRTFMREAVGYTALFESEHSSKSKKGGRRIKFYLNPILCPRFQIPEAKTKEPYYWNIDDLFDLAKKAVVTLERAQRSKPKNLDHTPFLPGLGE